MLYVFEVVPDKPGVGLGGLAVFAFFGVGGAYLMWGKVISTLISFLSSNGALLQCFKEFPINIKTVISRIAVDELVWAKIILVSLIIYIVINMLACIFTPKKHVVRITTAISYALIIIALIAFYTDPYKVSMRNYEYVIVYGLGTLIVIVFMAVPILISTIINATIYYGIRKINR